MAGRDSAGILMYRRHGGGIEVMIAHPGGPYWRNKHEGAWSVPKGEIDGGEDAMATAIREFAEETGHRVTADELIALGSIRQRSGKVVYAWAVEGDLDPEELQSNPFSIEWPPRSGRMQEFPEVDAFAWASPDEAARLLNPAQVAFVTRLVATLVGEGGAAS